MSAGKDVRPAERSDRALRRTAVRVARPAFEHRFGRSVELRGHGRWVLGQPDDEVDCGRLVVHDLRHAGEVDDVLARRSGRLREHERDGRFDDGFVELARAVYVTNDERARLKGRINALLGTDIPEAKQYTSY